MQPSETWGNRSSAVALKNLMISLSMDRYEIG